MKISSRIYLWSFAILGFTILFGCGEKTTTSYPESTPPDSICTGCNYVPVSVPVITATGGYGAVTSYGSVTDPQPSPGGACSYGSTQIMNYAAAFSSLEPGDEKGMWNHGHACGQCVKVRVGSSTGWREVVVRIVDQCPDGYCGIDLGGAPALALMGTQPGRFAGEWTYVSCNGAEGVSDGPPALFVKQGSNQWWSIVQIRNPPGAVTRMDWARLRDNAQGTLNWATEAENFYKIPDSLLSSSDSVRFTIHYWTGDQDSITLPGTSLGVSEANWIL